MPKEPKLTQRAYTLKLTGSREDLWYTHLFMNRATGLWCEILLGFRAGIPYTAAGTTDPNPAALSWRRRISALSWLTVESKPRIDLRFDWPIVQDPIVALRSILYEQGCPGDQIEHWINDCEPALVANRREGACWINRWQTWRTIQREMGSDITEEDRTDLIGRILGEIAEEYFERPTEELAAPKSLVQILGNWLTQRYGSGEGANYDKLLETFEALADLDPSRMPVNRHRRAWPFRRSPRTRFDGHHPYRSPARKGDRVPPCWLFAPSTRSSRKLRKRRG